MARKRSINLRQSFLVVLMMLLVSLAGAAQATVPSGPPKPSAPDAVAATSASREDWQSLSLATSGLHAQPPLVGEKDELPRFTRELIQVQWRQADPIDLYVIRPHGVEKPPAILYLYSYDAVGDRFRDNDWCERVTAGGFAAIGFVSALTGDRYHDRPMKKWFVSELPEALVTSVHDVQMILNYLATRGDIDMAQIGMLGTGSGATIAILAAAVDPRLKAIDLLEPWGDWPDWLAGSALIPEEERASYLKPEFLKQVAAIDPLQWLPQLKSQRVRLQYVADDPMIPKIVQERMAGAILPTAHAVKYDDNVALFRETSGGRFFDWIKQQVRSTAPLQPGTADPDRADASVPAFAHN